MRRDLKIGLAVLSSVPAAILGAATLCTWAIAHGASEQWRLLFRVICHGMAHRSFALFGEPMPICARCSGIYIGLFAGLLAFWVAQWASERGMRVAMAIAVAPLALDGLTQLAGLRESTNELRVATGIVAGLAFGLWVLCAVRRRDDAAFTSP